MRPTASRALLLPLLGIAACAARPESPAPAPIEVAITFDDLPSHGGEVAGLTRLALHQQILRVLAQHGVRQAYGFVNASAVEKRPELRAALEAWVAAGQPLGNHTFSHPMMKASDTAGYLADLDQGEPLLAALQPGEERRYRVFRYPYLEQGRTLEQRAAIRAHLDERGYRIAEVSLDFGDWGWNGAYARCLAKGDADAVERLHQSMLHEAAVQLVFADGFARRLFGRRIPLVLLLHAGAHTAARLDELLTLYERAGVRWVTLDDALKDPVYQLDPQTAPGWGNTLQGAVAAERKTDLIPWVRTPEKELTGYCAAPK